MPEARHQSNLCNHGHLSRKLCHQHCQTKFYTASWRAGAGWSPTVFAQESPTRSAGVDAENDLYSFALTVPSPDFDTPEGRVNNVFYGALSWILLHEIAHVHHGDGKLLPADLLVRREYRADDFATRWVLEDAGAGLYREFRVLMIVVALTWLFLHEQTVCVGSDHPPAILRLREASALFQMGDRENAAYVLKALLDPTTSAPPHDTAKESFEWISNRLEILFRAT
jgi:hypothetical protein